MSEVIAILVVLSAITQSVVILRITRSGRYRR